MTLGGSCGHLHPRRLATCVVGVNRCDHESRTLRAEAAREGGVENTIVRPHI